MRNIVIIGAGFGGLQAARVLSAGRKRINGHNIILVDKKKTSDFLPILPDVISGRIQPQNAQAEIKELSAKLRIDFINEEIISVDLKTKTAVFLSGSAIEYEYLILAAGSETNFYNKIDLAGIVYKIDGVADVIRLKTVLANSPGRPVLVIGGGYTGIEVATNIAVSRAGESSIFVVDIGKDILGPLPDWMKNYVRQNLKKLKINVLTGVSLDSYDGAKVVLSDGRSFDGPIVVWAPGVKTPAFINNLGVNLDRQGRVVVDEFLGVGSGVYAAGDCAAFNHNGAALRMAVQFAILEGQAAARNILREINGLGRARYNPIDLGYIVPMANALSCGIVMGIKIKGVISWFMHWVMCIYRSQSLSTKIGIIRNLFSKRLIEVTGG